MTTTDIVRQYLIDNGYDGLCTDDCACVVDDLKPCFGDSFHQCEPGYRVPCDPEFCAADGDCDFHISTKKPEVKRVRQR